VDRERMQRWVLEAVAECGGKATIVETAKQIWLRHESDLKASGDQFYTWQYDMRWAADHLRRLNKLKLDKVGSRSLWRI
jgi:uridine phosphorylase